jgi:poly-beta-1,6-N-acetyl-D-glucosamine synthase
MTDLVRQALTVAVQACFVYLLVTYALFAVQLFVAFVENLRRSREERIEDYPLLATSRFTIPVSVIIPAYNEAPVILGSVRSALDFDYFDHEVIVVNDGSRDDTLAVLIAEFGLQPLQVYYRRSLPTEEVRAIYRSPRHPRLLVVDKANGGKADALNMGLNLSRYRYVCCLDADSTYERDALLKGMRLAVVDPASVVGVTSVLAVGLHPERQGSVRDEARRVGRSLIINFQHLDYQRSFLNNRSAWSRLDYMLCAVGAFMIWRRDVLVEMGGFSRDFTCEDIEMTFRVYERLLREGRPCKVVALPDTLATTEGPARIPALIRQRARWQRVILETVWHYRRMLLNPRYRNVGLVGMPFYVVTEVLAPLFELAAVATLVLAVILEVFDFVQFLTFVAAISMLNACFTVAALLIQDRMMREVRWRDLLHLVLISPLELIAYRPWLTYARLKGTLEYFRGRKGWDKFDRNARRASHDPAPGPSGPIPPLTAAG